MSNYASPEEFNLADLLCCAASREVQDNEIVFAGTGLPMVAIMLAQRTHAPNLKLIFEAGTLDGMPLCGTPAAFASASSSTTTATTSSP